MGELCRIIRHLGSTREPENFSHALFAFPFFYRRQDRELLSAIFRGLLDCPCRVQPPPIANSIQENVQQTTKRVIAREWLTFVVLLAVGLTIAPLVVNTIVTKQGTLATLPYFYKALFSRDYWVSAWLILLAPYITYQLGRSLVWAVKDREGSMSSEHVYEVRPRKDHHGLDLICDALPFGRLWHCEPNAVSNAKAKRSASSLTP